MDNLVMSPWISSQKSHNGFDLKRSFNAFITWKKQVPRMVCGQMAFAA